MSDWNQRLLCPDGGCVGVIGPDGTCKVCGRAAPNWGEERMRGLVAPEHAEDDEYDDDYDDDAEYEDDEAYEDDAAEDEDLAASGDGEEWTERKLCPDGGCVGVIGSDGTCKVCGSSAA